MDYTTFASFFSVAAPYNGTDPYSLFREEPKVGIVFTMLDVIFVLLAALVVMILVGTTLYIIITRSKRAARSSETPVVYENAHVYPTAQEIATVNGEYAAALAHSRSVDYSNSADVYYTDPAHTLSPTHSAVSIVQAAEVTPETATPKVITAVPVRRASLELDLVPQTALQNAEIRENLRQKDILQLLDMGFAFNAAETALASCDWNKARAIELLTRSV
jgi:UBA/TS-N domain